MSTVIPTAPASLGTHKSVYDAIFQHPVSHSLQWREVQAMLGSVAEATTEANGGMKWARNGQTLSMHAPRHKDLSDVEDVMRIRHFLQRSAETLTATVTTGGHLLVVVDHREAKIYHTELNGAVPERISPVDATGASRHLRNVDNQDNGQRKPEPKAFYDAIAAALAGAEKILILGSATGASSAMDHLVAELKAHHPALAQRVVGALVVDEQHLTEAQLLAKAREVYAGLA